LRNKYVDYQPISLVKCPLNRPRRCIRIRGTTASRRYDSAGRMAANELASYRYDAASRITGITQLLQAQTVTSSVVPNPSGTGTTTVSTRYQPTTLTWTASYDSRDRLTALVRSNTSSRYQYDANSNRLTSVAQTIADTNGNTSFEALDTAANTAQALAVDANSNRLLGFTQSLTSVRGTQTLSTVNSAVNYSLDAAGNLASDGLRAFAYDATNRHTSTRYAAGADTATVQYLFNALGQRVFKSVVALSSGTGVVSGGANTTGSLTPMPTLGQFYSYADDSDTNLPSYALLGEYCNGASGCVQQEYLWLPLDNGQAIPVGMLRSSRLYAIHTDHLGTPRLIHDDSNTPVWQWAYSAFGENAPTGALKVTTNVNSVFVLGANNAKLAVSAPSITVNLRFAGQYADSESNLFQNGYRSYAPAIGSYSQMDPIGLGGGFNRRGYVGGNAFSLSDPYGLDPWYDESTEDSSCACNNVERTAKSNYGREWNNPAVANTCNEGVYDNLKEAGVNAPNRYPNWMGKYPLGAGAGGWSDRKTKIEGWVPTTRPRAGDVVAGDGGTGSAHVGIVVIRKNGSLGSAGVSSADGVWRETRWPFNNKNKPANFWRCTCK
jgi:RHS repeat-associated protein